MRLNISWERYSRIIRYLRGELLKDLNMKKIQIPKSLAYAFILGVVGMIALVINDRVSNETFQWILIIVAGITLIAALWLLTSYAREFMKK